MRANSVEKTRVLDVNLDSGGVRWASVMYLTKLQQIMIKIATNMTNEPSLHAMNYISNITEDAGSPLINNVHSF